MSLFRMSIMKSALEKKLEVDGYPSTPNENSIPSLCAEALLP